MKEFFKKWTPSIIFNVGESIIIYTSGVWLGLDWRTIFFVFLSYAIARLTVGSPMHYKAWQLCLVWSTSVFMSLFVVAGTDMIMSGMMATFMALIISKNANIGDLYQWNHKQNGEKKSKYHREMDYVR